MSLIMKFIIALSLIISLGTSIFAVDLTEPAAPDWTGGVTVMEVTPGLTSADMAGTAWLGDDGSGVYFSGDGKTFADMYGYLAYVETEPGVYHAAYDGEVDMAYPTTLSMEDGKLILTTWDVDVSWWSEYTPLDMAAVYGGTEWIGENDALYAFDGEARVFAGPAETIDVTGADVVLRHYDRELSLRYTAADGTLTERTFQRNDMHYQLGGTSWMAADGLVYTFQDGGVYHLFSSDETIWYSLLSDNLYWRSVTTDEDVSDDEADDASAEEVFYDYYITCEGDELVITGVDYDGQTVSEERLTRVTD